MLIHRRAIIIRKNIFVFFIVIIFAMLTSQPPKGGASTRTINVIKLRVDFPLQGLGACSAIFAMLSFFCAVALP